MQRRLDEIQKFTESHGWSRMSKWISQNDVSVRVKHNMSGADGRLIRNKDKSADSRSKCNTLRKVLPWEEHTSIFHLRNVPSSF